MNRLKELRKTNHLTQRDIADILDVTPSAVSFWESGKNNMDWKAAAILAKRFGSTPEYILGETNVIDHTNTHQVESGFKIPILGTIRAGIPVAAIEDIDDWEEIPISMAKTGEFVALKVKGDSMEPQIKEGDIAIIRRQETVENGDIAVVLVNGDEATIKKVKFSPDGIMLIGFNTAVYEPHFYNKEEIAELPIRIYGRLVEVRRKF